MPVDATYDVLNERPLPVESPFELAAPRILAGWLETRHVRVTDDDFRLAVQFLKRVGTTVEPLSTFDVRLVSERGQDSIVTREAAVLTAVRSLVALDVQRTARSIARAA